MNWFDARTKCLSMGRNLFEIRSDVDFDLGIHFLRDIHNWSGFWIGIKQESGKWVYDSDGEHHIGFWAIDRPIGSTSLTRTYLFFDGLWDDAGESDLRTFVCELI